MTESSRQRSHIVGWLALLLAVCSLPFQPISPVFTVVIGLWLWIRGREGVPHAKRFAMACFALAGLSIAVDIALVMTRTVITVSPA